MKPGRLTWIDYARGIAIILVLYRHVFEGIKESGLSVSHYMYLEYANIFFFSFRMPLFFIVSGIFVSASLKKRGLQHFISTKAGTILYPYFLWACIQISLQWVFSKYTNGHPTAQTYLYLFYLPREVDQFWYLYALFNVTVLYVIMKEKLHFKPVHHIIFGIVLYVISAVTYQKNIIIGFVGDIFHYYIFIAIGDVISRYMMDRNNFKYFESSKILALLLLPFIAVQAYFLKQNILHADYNYMYVEYFQPVLYVAIALLGCGFIINLAFVLQRLNWKALSWLPVLGRHSLYIYVSHVIVFASIRILLHKVFGINNVPLLLIVGIVSGLIIPLFVYKLCVRLNMRWLFTLDKDDDTSLKKAKYIKPVSLNVINKSS